LSAQEAEPPLLCPPFRAFCEQDNYGQKSSECEARVKAVFLELELPRRFKEYEAASYKRINDLIDGLDESQEGVKKDVYRSFLAKVYKRQK
jgi:farnesyl diphosphate synthase